MELQSRSFEIQGVGSRWSAIIVRLGRQIAIAVAVLLIASACREATRPEPRLGGLWIGQLTGAFASDSLIIAIWDSMPQVSAMAFLTPQRGLILYGVAPTSRTSVVMELIDLDHQGAAVLATIDMDFDGSEVLVGESKVYGLPGPSVLRKHRANVTGLPGRWVLRAIRSPIPYEQPFDTLTLQSDGLFTRSRQTHSCGYVTSGYYRRTGQWVVMEYFRGDYFCGRRPRDSLQIKPDSLTRRTLLIGGSSVEEVYARMNR